jgi:hypothetical protein
MNEQDERLSPRGRLDPTETQAMKVWRLCRGPRRGQRRSHTVMEEKTGGAVSRDGIWNHQSVSVVRARRLRRVLRAVSGRAADIIRYASLAEPWDLKRMQSGSSRYTDSQLEEPG